MNNEAALGARYEKGVRLAADPVAVERMERCLRAINGFGVELARFGIWPATLFPVPDLGTPVERDYLIGRVLSYAEQGLGLRKDEH